MFVAVRYEPHIPCPPTLPLPSPPFHQISLPASPAPFRKLQTVRFSTVTLAAFQTMIPFSPCAFPLIFGPRFWSAALVLQAGPLLVPSTITVLRFMPTIQMSGLVTSTPADSSARPRGCRLEGVLSSPGA